MKTKLAPCALAALFAVCAPSVWAADLNMLNVASLPGDRVELKLSFDEPVEIPRGYTIDQPARIALDFPGVSNKLKQKHQQLGTGNARSVTVVEAQERTRLIINLSSMTGYSARTEGNDVYVVVGEGVAQGQAQRAPMASAPAPVRAPAKAVASAASVTNIDFQRGTEGEGNVIIELGSAAGSPDITEKGNKVELTFPGTSLPEELRVRLDVKDFATPVHYISAQEKAGGTTIVVESSGGYDYMAYQTDNRMTVSVKQLTREERAKLDAERFTYTGEKLSLNFQDIDVRSVLQLIADFTDLNLVASDTVQGNITLRLQHVPWDQALELVLKTKGLAQRKVGNVLLVAPAEEIAARERQELEAQQQLAELAPLRRELIQVNYAKAADIAALFQSVADGKDSSERGTVTVDERTNSIIAYQTDERLEELRRVVTQLDIPVRQVMIEARVVESYDDFDKEIGVRWGGAFSGGKGKWNAFGKDGNLGIKDEDGFSCGPFGGRCTLPVNDGGSPVPFVDLGANGATSGIGIGFVSNRAILDLQLSAMEKTGKGKIISQPKVVTSDRETAKIMKGKEVPYQEASSSGSTSTSFKEATLSLEVTPQITPDNRIIMDVKVTKDEVDFANALDGVPPINKNEVNAKVLIADAETLVLGGVFSEQELEGVEKVPVLGDIPYLGRLFKRNMKITNKAELLIFITPRIVANQAVTLNH